MNIIACETCGLVHLLESVPALHYAQCARCDSVLQRRHADSKFWNAGGINVDLKLFGINFSTESLKSLIIGGIAIATPTSSGILATNGSTFPLNEKLDDKWLKWSPAITIPNSNSTTSQNSPSSLLLNTVNPDSDK